MLRLFLLSLSMVVLAAGKELVCTHPYINVGERCIIIDPWQTGNMAAVRAICKAHGGDILWLDGDTDCEFYRDLLTHIHENNLNEKSYWMGVTDEGHNEVWRFLRSNVVVRTGPPYWYSGFPTASTTKNCAILNRSKSYYWEEVTCTTIASTICRKA